MEAINVAITLSNVSRNPVPLRLHVSREETLFEAGFIFFTAGSFFSDHHIWAAMRKNDKRRYPNRKWLFSKSSHSERLLRGYRCSTLSMTCIWTSGHEEIVKKDRGDGHQVPVQSLTPFFPSSASPSRHVWRWRTPTRGIFPLHSHPAGPVDIVK